LLATLANIIIIYRLFTYTERRDFKHSSAIFVRVTRALGGTFDVVDPYRAVVRRMTVSAKTRVSAGKLEIFVARAVAMLGADVWRVDEQDFDGLVFLERPVHVRLFVATQVMVTRHSGRFQPGGEHIVMFVIAALVFLATRTRDVAIRSSGFQLGFDRRTYETTQTLRPDRRV